MNALCWVPVSQETTNYLFTACSCPVGECGYMKWSTSHLKSKIRGFTSEFFLSVLTSAVSFDVLCTVGRWRCGACVRFVVRCLKISFIVCFPSFCRPGTCSLMWTESNKCWKGSFTYTHNTCNTHNIYVRTYTCTHNTLRNIHFKVRTVQCKGN